MNIKKIFCNVTSQQAEPEVVNLGLYSDMLGLNRKFEFILSKKKVKDNAEFDLICNEAEASLKHDLKRFGESYYKIPNELRNKLMGTIGSMTLYGDNDGNLSVKFHKRDSDGYWDGISKKYPEKDKTAKYKREFFFSLEEDDEE